VTRPMGKLERLCRERHERDLALAARPGGHPKGYRFDAEAAERPVQFIERFCRHFKGEWAGQLIVLEDWQRWIIRVLFGWLRADGTRRYRKAWIEIARKNSKTTLAGALGLFLLVADGEAGAEVYTTATKKEQAQICHEAMRRMVEASPELRRFVKVPKKLQGNLVCDRLGSKAQILSSDYGTQDGLSPSADIRDEVHEWEAQALADVLDTAAGARRQPLTIEITTAGVYDVEGVGWKHHDYAVQIAEGLIEDDRQFVFIAAIDENDDWTDAKCRAACSDHSDPSCVLRKANPNLGISPKIDYINEQIDEAQQNPAKVNAVLRYHCNRWTQQVTRWLDLERWKQSEDAAMREEDLVGRLGYGGLDLAEKIDLCAFVIVFPGPDRRIDIIGRFWLPEAQIAIQAKKGRPFLRQWAEEGWLTATPGEVIDHALIRREINDLHGRFTFTEIGYDEHAATQVATQLAEEDGITMVPIRQGTLTLSEPSKLLEATIVERKARATGKPGGPNPVMRWMVGNATKRADANLNIAPDKKRSKDKIDGISATVSAMARFVGMKREEPTGSYLDHEEVLVV
jgi:phage terminase large subunit-like protein